jgi:thiamine-monophosphate kinase
MENKKFQQVQEIGFSSLIDKLSQYSGKRRDEVLVSIGDDSAVFQNKPGDVSVISSEIFLEGIHFDLSYHPFQHLGYKLVTATVSDIFAMNAKPVQLLINIAVPNKYSVQMMEDLYKGADAACKDYNIELSGGDTTASHQLLAISLAATGSSKKDKLVYRKGAKHNDLICVTGDLGSAIAGLRVLMREKKFWKESGQETFQPDFKEYEYVVKRQLVPAARTDLIDAFVNADVMPTSLIDLSKGLIADAKQIAIASKSGLEIFSPAIPISLETRKVADEMKEDVDKYAFYGGEDYEMLFTINEQDAEKLRSEFGDFAVIGKMTSEHSEFRINTGEDKTIQIEL